MPGRYNAGTPMGHSMEDKVLKPLLHKKLKDKSLRKPLLVCFLLVLPCSVSANRDITPGACSSGSCAAGWFSRSKSACCAPHDQT